MIYRQRSTEFPFTVNINGPGASAIALEELPGELPLALIFSLANDRHRLAGHRQAE